jgi:hypothetical protein
MQLPVQPLGARHEAGRKQAAVAGPGSSARRDEVLEGESGKGGLTSTTAPRYLAPGGRATVELPGVGVVSLSDSGMVRC